IKQLEASSSSSSFPSRRRRIGTRPSFQATLWRGGGAVSTPAERAASVELPDAVVSGVGVAFGCWRRPWAVAVDIRQERSCISGIRDRGGPATNGRVGFELRPCSSSSSNDCRKFGEFNDCQSQMIGSPAANQVGAAAQQPEPRKTAAPGPANQQRRSSNIGSTANQGKMDETAEKFRFTDPAVGASAPSLFLQRLVELSALQAETVPPREDEGQQKKASKLSS
uniref:Pentatricopeptide repeat-containing protein n=1 Tax=Macrostomum lignano TaxID=282301 RepID=A0A1I8F2Z7_9PLAT